jgi:hypothetical protein
MIVAMDGQLKNDGGWNLRGTRFRAAHAIDIAARISGI